MFRLLCLFLGYGIGCIQTAYIVGKIMGKIDIRDYGSGNAGATNVKRVLGTRAAIVVFLSDIFKGALGYTICYYIFKDHLVAGLYGGLGVILGHNFPFYLKFKGGKGISATIGIILCLNIKMALLIFLIAFVFFYFTKYISVGSLFIVAELPIFMLFFQHPIEAVAITVIFALMAFYQHKANIFRIIQGTENKFYLKKKGMSG